MCKMHRFSVVFNFVILRGPCQLKLGGFELGLTFLDCLLGFSNSLAVLIFFCIRQLTLSAGYGPLG